MCYNQITKNQSLTQHCVKQCNQEEKMKKLITTMIAVMVMAFSVVPAFAVSSPVATSPAGGGGKSSDSPKTGSSDILAYTLLAASAAGCGVASIALVKSAKKK